MSETKSILDFVPEGFNPTKDQRSILLKYERLSLDVRVVVAEAPVAAGKTLIGSTIARYEAWRGRASTIINVENTLHFQWAKALPDFMKAPYRQGHSAKDWTTVKHRWNTAPLRLANLYSYLAHRSYTPVIIGDEGHKWVEAMQDFEGIKIWKHLSSYPDNLRSILDVLRWANDAEGKEAKKLRDMFKNGVENYTMDVAIEDYRGSEHERIRVYPLTPRNNKPIFWPPSRVKRIVLMSATLSEEDLFDLGLDRSYIAWLSCDSRIPEENRPALYDPVGNFSYHTQSRDMPKLVEAILEASIRHEGEKGLVHVTYSLAAKLAAFPELRDNPRIIFHSKWNKQTMFDRWQSTTDSVFIAAGFAEGIDLPYDKCRWQGIAKIIWPNKSDIAVAAKLEQRPDWYGWSAMKTLMQMYGRVCRQPDDFGITYIWSSEFETLLRKYYKFAAKWFVAALR